MEMEKTYILTKASLSTIDEDIATKDEIIAKYQSLNDRTLETQRDLMKITSILLSIGMNKNDDFFLKEEVLPARNTGAHKPLNMEHKDSEIVGHMLRTYVTLKDGTEVPDDNNDVPDDFDITNEAVMYKFVFPDLAKSIKERALNNKLFVSVEVWFKNYDYVVGDKIVRRNQSTSSVLDNCLRINGGEGLYKGQKVGRVLRDMLIGGIGIVENPANPESVIKSVSNLQELDVVNIDREISDNIIGEIPVNKAIACDKSIKQGELEMRDYKVIAEEIRALDEFNSACSKKLEEKTEPKKIEEKTEKTEAQEKTVQLGEIPAEQLEKWKKEDIQKSRTLVMREEEIEVLKAENSMLKKEVKGFKQEKVMNDRLQVLKTELGLSDEVADEKNKTYAGLSDEEFVARIEDVKSYVKSSSKEEESIKAESEPETKPEVKSEGEPAAEKSEDISAEVKGGEQIEQKTKEVKKEEVLDEIPDLKEGKEIDPALDLKSEPAAQPTIAEKMTKIFEKYYIPQYKGK